MRVLIPTCRLAAAAMLVLSLASTASAQRFTTTRVNTTAQNGEAVGPIGDPPGTASVSGDGRYVAFDTGATNLVPGDANGVIDVYLKDRTTGEVVRVSRGLAGAEPNARSFGPSISRDGRWVAFYSNASNLVAGDTNGLVDAFVFDRVLQSTVRVSVSSGGAEKTWDPAAAENDFIPPGTSVVISATGRFVLFSSRAANLVPGDTNAMIDVFVRDRDTDGDALFDEPGGVTTTRVSVATDGTQGNANSYAEAITPDGRHVSFISYASTLVAGDTNADAEQPWLSLVDVFVRDRNTDGNATLDEVGGVRTVRVSVTSAGGQTTLGRSVGGGLSDNGRFVVFGSSSDELVPEDDNNKEDVFVHDRNPDGDAAFDEPGQVATSRISVSSTGEEGNDYVDHGDGYHAASISASGRFVSFTSESTNLAANDHNGQADIFVRDRDIDNDGVFDEAGFVSTSRVSVASDDTEQVQTGSFSSRSTISADGRIVVFWSTAANLVPDDTNNLRDLFAFDQFAWSLTSLGQPGASVVNLEVSGDGRWIVFESAGSIYLRDRSRPDTDLAATQRVDVSASGVPAAGASTTPEISEDGRFVVFASVAANLVAGDTNGVSDIFVRDRDVDLDGILDEAGQVRVFRANVGPGGTQAVGGPSDGPSLSPNGEWIAFSSLATNLGVTPQGFRQVYRHHRLTRVTIGISQRNGLGGNGDSRAPAVSNNGVVAFESASNSLTYDTNGEVDVYASIPPELTGFTGPYLYAMSRYDADVSFTGSGSEPTISPDGHWVAYTSTGDLRGNVVGARTAHTNVYFQIVHTLSWTPFLASRPNAGGLGNGPSRRPVMAAVPGVPDQYRVYYVSRASNLVANDTNGVDDVFSTVLTATYGWGPQPFGTGFGATVEQTTRVSVSPDGSQLPTATDAVVRPSSNLFLVMGAKDTTQPEQPQVQQRQPKAESVRPAGGPLQGGTRITIFGEGLDDGNLLPRLERAGESIALIVDATTGRGQTSEGKTYLEAITPAIGAPGREFNVSVGYSPATKMTSASASFTYGAPPCEVSVGEPSNAIAAAGGTATLTVAGTPGCEWAVGSRPTWLGVAPERGVVGDIITLTAEANAEYQVRTGALEVGATQRTVVQQGAACAPGLFVDGAPAGSLTVGSTTATAAVEIRTGESCAWSVVNEGESWLVPNGPSAGNGTAVLSWTVSPNTSVSQRYEDFLIAGLPFRLLQAAAASQTLTATPPIGGRILSPAGLDCGAACSTAVGQGAQVTLTAAPSQNHAFDRWTGDCAFANESPTCVLTIAGDRSVGALFRPSLPEQHRLTIQIVGTGAGTVVGSGLACPGTCAADFGDGTIISLARTAAAGSGPGTWSAGCADVMAMNADRVCSVSFNSLQSTDVVLTVEVVGNGAGTVTSSVGGIVCGAGGSTCTQNFAPGTAVALTATPAAGSSVGAWEPAACGTGPMTLSQNLTCRATFSVNAAPRTLTVSVTGRGTVTSLPAGITCPGDCSETFPDASVVRLFAVPQNGASLGDWGGACIGRDACGVRLTADASVSKAFADTTAAPLTLSDIRPTSGLASGGGKIRLYGSGFAQSESASVTIGGRPALGVVVVDDTTIVAAVPPLEPPSGPVPASRSFDVVVNVGGATGTLNAAYRGIVLDGSATTDTDGDAMPDHWEAVMGVDPLVADATVDTDGDGITNAAEHAAGTHPAGFYARYLAEGVNNAFFHSRVATANATSVPATTLMRFQRAQSEESPYTIFTVPGEARRLVFPSRFPGLAADSFGTVVESDVELAVDRQVFWDPFIHGSHAGTSVAAPRTQWYLAEGSTGGRFDLFYLLQNATAQPAEVRIRYLLPAGGPIEKTYVVAARRRVTVWVDDIPELGNTDVSAVIESTNNVPIIVERAMYISSDRRPFEGGHNSAAVEAPATSWFLAEGATGTFFDTYVLLANPNPTGAVVQARYLLPDGTPIERSYEVGPNSRRTVWVDGEDPRLAATSVSTIVTSTNGVPIIAERSMWWPGPESAAANPAVFPIVWGEAHNSPGSTVTATKWAVGDGDTGPAPLFTRTYLLVANTSSFAATVRVTLLSERDFPPLRREYTLPANSRFTVDVAAQFPETLTTHTGYGAVVESLPTPERAQIVVERAMYNNAADGLFWAGGTNILATPVR